MTGILLILALAVTVEAMVEYVKSVVKMVTERNVKTLITQLSALAVSILLCFAAGADLYAALGLSFSIPGIGIVLTGLFASRGANYVSDLVRKLRDIGGRGVMPTSSIYHDVVIDNDEAAERLLEVLEQSGENAKPKDETEG